MGSTNLVPGTGSFGNPAGMSAYGLNPLGDLENLKSLASFIPGADTGAQAKILGASAKTGSPFVPSPGNSIFAGGDTSATTNSNPFAVAAPGGNSNVWKPPVANPTSTSDPSYNFGYPTGSNNQASLNALTSLQPGSGWTSNNMGWVTDPNLRGSLEKTYGKGFGRTLDNVLTTGAGFNPQVANAFINAVQPYFQSNLGNIMSQFGAAGARFSSSAALASGKATADFTAQEQTFMAQMYQWAYGNYLSILTGAANKSTGSNTFGDIGNILSLISSGAGGLQAGGVGAGGTLGKILGGLASL